MVAVTGAIEIAVHGWDISVACGARRPVPPGLAAILLPIAPLLITPDMRPGLFADPVRLPGPACPGDQLVAFLGRQPRKGAAAPEPGTRRGPASPAELTGRPATILGTPAGLIYEPPNRRRGTHRNTAALGGTAMTIADKVVLVTGANRGIGQALVEEALRRGATRVYAGTRQPMDPPG